VTKDTSEVHLSSLHFTDQGNQRQTPMEREELIEVLADTEGCSLVPHRRLRAEIKDLGSARSYKLRLLGAEGGEKREGDKKKTTKQGQGREENLLCASMEVSDAQVHPNTKRRSDTKKREFMRRRMMIDDDDDFEEHDSR
jgi:hypothetical protein